MTMLPLYLERPRNRIIYHLENAQAHTSFCDESQSIGDVLNILINSKTSSTKMFGFLAINCGILFGECSPTVP